VDTGFRQRKALPLASPPPLLLSSSLCSSLWKATSSPKQARQFTGVFSALFQRGRAGQKKKDNANTEIFHTFLDKGDIQV